MAYCRYCGQEVYPDAVVCVHCGRSLENKNITITDSGSVGWAFLGFFFPIVGLILYLVWKEERPKTAKMVGRGALINVIVSVALFLIYIVIIVIILGFAIGAASMYTVSFI